MEVYSLEGRWDLKQAGKKDRIPARYADNFFHLREGHPATIEITIDESVTLGEMMQKLKLRSLYDTYR